MSECGERQADFQASWHGERPGKAKQNGELMRAKQWDDRGTRTLRRVPAAGCGRTRPALALHSGCHGCARRAAMMTGPPHKQKSDARADHRRCVESWCVMTRWTGLLGIRSAQRLCAEMAERKWSAEKGQARQRALSQPGSTNARAACWERAARACRAGFGETARRLRADLTRCARQSFPVAWRCVVTLAAVHECVAALHPPLDPHLSRRTVR